VRAGEFARINTPAFLFASGTCAGLAMALCAAGALRIAALLASWWCASGAVMQFVDFRRKRAIFERSVPYASRIVSGPVPDSLRGTLCGRSILWALTWRVHHPTG